MQSVLAYCETVFKTKIQPAHFCVLNTPLSLVSSYSYEFVNKENMQINEP